MFRRRYIVGVGTVVFAGCSGTDSDPAATDTPPSTTSDTKTATGTEADSPASPVIQHYKALDANDFETANAAIHSESPRGELSDESIERARVSNYTIDSTEVFDEDTETPEVTASVTATNTDTEETQTLDLRIEVRKDDGVWKMYQIV